MKIGIDIDGVLADFCTAYEHLHVRVTGRNTFPVWAPYQGPTSWNWPDEYGYTKAETSKVWDLIKSTPGFWVGLDPIFQNLDALMAVYTPWRQAGHEFFFVTTRPGTTAKYQTERWLQTWFHCPTVIVAKTGTKGEIARVLELDAFIDDNADNCKDLITQSKALTYLLPRRYNAYMHHELDGMGCRVAADMRMFLDDLGLSKLG